MLSQWGRRLGPSSLVPRQLEGFRSFQEGKSNGPRHFVWLNLSCCSSLKQTQKYIRRLSDRWERDVFNEAFGARVQTSCPLKILLIVLLLCVMRAVAKTLAAKTLAVVCSSSMFSTPLGCDVSFANPFRLSSVQVKSCQIPILSLNNSTSFRICSAMFSVNPYFVVNIPVIPRFMLGLPFDAMAGRSWEAWEDQPASLATWISSELSLVVLV